VLTQMLANSVVSSDGTLVSEKGAQQRPVEHRSLAWHMPSLQEVVQCQTASGEHLAEVQCLAHSAGQFPEERKKEVKKEHAGVRDKRMHCQRPPGQVWFLHRPCCKSCFQQGCVTPACEQVVLLGEGAHSELGVSDPKALTLVGQFENTYDTGRYKLLFLGSIPN